MLPSRLRKLIGAVLLLVLVTVWALAAMALAQTLVVNAHPVGAGLYYFLAGLGWVLPAMPLIRWMSRPDTHPSRPVRPHRPGETRA